MNVVVLTPGKEIYKGTVSSVKVPGVSGQFEVLNGHAAIVSSLGEGVVRLRENNGKEILFNITSGFIEVLQNEVSLLVQGYSEQ
jgi:F-type H+-transporting ATPase subunit epsilon